MRGFGLRNRVERFFRYLRERIMIFHHKLSARNHVQGVMSLKLFLNLFTPYYEAARTGRWVKNAYPDTINTTID
jgi:hypothetical protein